MSDLSDPIFKPESYEPNSHRNRKPWPKDWPAKALAGVIVGLVLIFFLIILIGGIIRVSEWAF